MDLFKVLKVRSGLFYMYIIILSLINGLINVALLLIINTALRSKTTPIGLDKQGVISFLLVIVISYFSSKYFQLYMNELTKDIICRLELNIIDLIRRSSYENFEHMGSEKAYSALGDAAALGRIPDFSINILKSLVTIICGLVYLFYTSPVSGLFLFIIMVILLSLYMYRERKIKIELNQVRDLLDTFYDHLGQLLDGFRQVRMSFKRNHSIFNDFITKNRVKSKDIDVRISKLIAGNELAATYSWYLILGIILYLLPSLFKIDNAQKTAFVTTVLFMMAPLSQITSFFPAYSRFRIAFQRLKEFNAKLQENKVDIDQPPKIVTFNTIRFENIVYTYKSNNERSFMLVIDQLQLAREEITFIIGPNGSGKSSFLYLLTGLYTPSSGKVFIDDKEVDWEEYRSLCNNMSVIFTSHHLFKYNYDGWKDINNGAHLQKYTRKYNLEGIAMVDPSTNTISSKLSKGQQNRVSLILSELEKKPWIILDEWAAEQDLDNRRTFYNTWIQELRDQGKGVIIITHDDAFYKYADRIISFDKGRITMDHYQMNESQRPQKQ